MATDDMDVIDVNELDTEMGDTGTDYADSANMLKLPLTGAAKVTGVPPEIVNPEDVWARPEYEKYRTDLATERDEMTKLQSDLEASLGGIKKTREYTIDDIQRAQVYESVMANMIKAFSAYYGIRTGTDMSKVDVKTGIDWGAALNTKLGALREESEELRGSASQRYKTLTDRLAEAKATRGQVVKSVDEQNKIKLRSWEAQQRAEAAKGAAGLRERQINAAIAHGKKMEDISERGVAAREKTAEATVKRAEKVSPAALAPADREKIKAMSTDINVMERQWAADRAAITVKADSRDRGSKNRLQKTRLMIAEHDNIDVDKVPSSGDELAKAVVRVMNERKQMIEQQKAKRESFITERGTTAAPAPGAIPPLVAAPKLMKSNGWLWDMSSGKPVAIRKLNPGD
jgi:hypothetical protein